MSLLLLLLLLLMLLVSDFRAGGGGWSVRSLVGIFLFFSFFWGRESAEKEGEKEGGGCESSVSYAVVRIGIFALMV